MKQRRKADVLSASPCVHIFCELPPFSGITHSVDLHLAIVEGGTPQPNRFNHLTYIVGVDGLTTSVRFSTTVKTYGEIPPCDIIDPANKSGGRNYSLWNLIMLPEKLHILQVERAKLHQTSKCGIIVTERLFLLVLTLENQPLSTFMVFMLFDIESHLDYLCVKNGVTGNVCQ